MATKSTKRTPQSTHATIKKLVVPDKLDLRDRAYQPRVASAPTEVLLPDCRFLPVLNQSETSACTGFALSNVVNYLLWKSDRGKWMPC